MLPAGGRAALRITHKLLYFLDNLFPPQIAELDWYYFLKIFGGNRLRVKQSLFISKYAEL